MNLHEWAIGGVYLGPLFVYGVLALLLTALSLCLLQRSGLGRHLWHGALFGCALFVLWLAGIVAVLAT